ncbi:MAG: FAD-dependent oxidoreductase [Terriglobia bacterium]
MEKTYDVAVIGAGVFGAWTAYHLQRAGSSVILLDAYGAANARASSGGESRIIRAGYGPRQPYTELATRALTLWEEFFERTNQAGLFHRTGVLWLAHEKDEYERACLATLAQTGVRAERLSRQEIEKRYPQFNAEGIAWGFLEPSGGVLMARRCVQAVVQEAVREGVRYCLAAVQAPGGPTEGSRGNSRLDRVIIENGTGNGTGNGEAVSAGVFVFACGPWLPKIFPKLLGSRIFPTRQEVFFFGVPGGNARFAPPAMPAWISLGDEFYGIPDLESRGFKVACDRHGARFDPDADARVISSEGLEAVRAYLARRLPALAGAPVVETRVCQYENTSNGDFLIDRHPDFADVWLVGGGSGHGFKHGPAVGEYAAARINEGGEVSPCFSLATKATVQQRALF